MFEIMPFDRRSYRMSSYNPFRELEQMEKNFWGDQQVNPFRTDISETADGYKLVADLPGFRKEDIHIDIDDDILSSRSSNRASESLHPLISHFPFIPLLEKAPGVRPGAFSIFGRT